MPNLNIPFGNNEREVRMQVRVAFLVTFGPSYNSIQHHELALKSSINLLVYNQLKFTITLKKNESFNTPELLF